MKKLTFICLLFIGTQLAFAQTSFGLKAGINFSKINDDIVDYDFKTGFYVGGFANIKFAEKFAFQPEILFSAQGAKKEDFEISTLIGTQIVTYNTEIDTKLYYINIPLMFKYYPLKKLNLEAGPQIGFAIKNEITTKSEEFGTESGEPNSNIDIGLNFGLEYNLYKGLGIGARYNLGLNDIVKDSNTKNKNSVISLGISYAFN